MARANEKSYAVGQGKTNEDIRRREANLGVDQDCLANLVDSAPGARDLFGRTVEQLEYTIQFQKGALEIARSYR